MSKIKGKDAVAELVRKIALTIPKRSRTSVGRVRVQGAQEILHIRSGTNEVLTLTMKLPLSRDEVLNLPYAEPSRYGLGKSGWVTFFIDDNVLVDPADLEEWIDESYRTIAPKTLVKQLPAL